MLRLIEQQGYDPPMNHELERILRLSTTPVFNIKAVRQATDVLASTLRAWERRYGILEPQRTESGYRLYSERDIAVIRWLKHKLAEGMTIGQAAALLEASLPGRGISHPQWPLVETPPLVELRDAVRDALLDLDETAANQGLSDAFSRFPIETVCLNLLAPILRDIGERWYSGEASIAQEHFASHWTRQKILGLMAATPYRTAGRLIITASAPTDQHEIGILLIALFLQRAGYAVLHLGANLAADGLGETLSHLRPALLLISATHLEAAQHIPAIAREIERMAEPRPMLGYGGQVFNHSPELRAQTPGVFLGRDAGDVVATVERLMRGGPV
ncbi:MAG: MerR family transcriptional regulator [Anaerolineae bacterium]|nr:MerR family transcriptional regulator [Anaerolineae bacterium]